MINERLSELRITLRTSRNDLTRHPSLNVLKFVQVRCFNCGARRSLLEYGSLGDPGLQPGFGSKILSRSVPEKLVSRRKSQMPLETLAWNPQCGYSVDDIGRRNLESAAASAFYSARNDARSSELSNKRPRAIRNTIRSQPDGSDSNPAWRRKVLEQANPRYLRAWTVRGIARNRRTPVALQKTRTRLASGILARLRGREADTKPAESNLLLLLVTLLHNPPPVNRTMVIAQLNYCRRTTGTTIPPLRW